MYKLAVVGDKDSIISFKVLGIDIYPIEYVDDEEEMSVRVKKVIEHLVAKEYGIIFITEEYAKSSSEVIDRYKAMTLPIITLIPSNRGSLDIGMAKIDENIEKAIGTNIF